MKGVQFLVAFVLLALASKLVSASDPGPLQDFCVAINDTKDGGMIHFQFNIGSTNAVAFAALSSQNPGVITIANAVFGSDPAINPDVLAKAFQLDQNIVKQLQSRFWWDNN
ncbi:hypothetical protein GOBAR_AA24349 [Gossypium barbadense]|uniref:Germin-like protein n=1 Tax=Gossypium barbadense TaxID=3634 RepID=A0A2P5WZ33_GOSBA|nr:hypothetical protein GOBAR_AA24349 [Gossypium barbadense]